MASFDVNSQLESASTAFERSSKFLYEQDETDWSRAQHWQLDATEWERVEMLRQEFRQHVSDRQISPLEILGLHARTEAERERYAQRWAALMIADAERILLFQRAYDEAVRKLLGDQPLIDITKLQPRTSSIPLLLQADRLVVFVSLDCLTCEEVLSRALRTAPQIAGVDVYFAGLRDGDQPLLTRWARVHGIPSSEVRAGRITLNFDEGLMARVHPRAEKVPVLMRRRGDRFEPLNPWELP